MKPSEYVESWRILLWDKAFQPFLHPAANPPFLKGSTFEDHPGAPLAEKRVLYRYFPIPFTSLNVFHFILTIHCTFSYCCFAVKVHHAGAHSKAGNARPEPSSLLPGLAPALLRPLHVYSSATKEVCIQPPSSWVLVPRLCCELYSR